MKGEGLEKSDASLADEHQQRRKWGDFPLRTSGVVCRLSPQELLTQGNMGVVSKELLVQR